MKAIGKVAVVVLLLSLLAGCAGMTSQQQRVLSGGAIGAGTGAALSAITGGNVLTGTAIGAGAGALGGFIYDQSKRHR